MKRLLASLAVLTLSVSATTAGDPLHWDTCVAANDSMSWELASAQVSKNYRDGLTLVMLSSSHCGPCRVMDKILRDCASDLPPVRVYEDRSDKNTLYDVSAVPTFALVDKEGNDLGHKVGMMSESELKSWIEDRSKIEPDAEASNRSTRRTTKSQSVGTDYPVVYQTVYTDVGAYQPYSACASCGAGQPFYTSGPVFYSSGSCGAGGCASCGQTIGGYFGMGGGGCASCGAGGYMGGACGMGGCGAGGCSSGSCGAGGCSSCGGGRGFFHRR